MVAEATKSPAVYDLRRFSSRDAVGARVALARKAIREEFDREMQPLGLSAQQAFVIILLGEDRGETAADMCRTLAHDAGAMTRLIDKLEAAGLVRRTRGSRDRRSARLELTKSGRTMYGQVMRVQVDVLNRMLRGLSRTEVRTLERLLQRIVDNG
ncbi:MAG TPA: MarR family winged helix-turn-helix transcriptional regulator [Burkholderiales bacterium]|nr:MarR family winged helix-turn-helix transcriptional regulator [Burkholderiales bacterium]